MARLVCLSIKINGFPQNIELIIFKAMMADLVYGLQSGRSYIITEIAGKRKDSIAPYKTVERLSRNLMNFCAPVISLTGC